MKCAVSSFRRSTQEGCGCVLADSQLDFVPYSREFLARSWEWLNDPETKALTLTPDFTRDQQRDFFEMLSVRADYLIWGVSLGGDPIGACGLKHITEIDAEYWGYIGEKQYWGHGLGRQLIEHCEGIARARGLKILYLHVDVDNSRAKNLYKKCGFAEGDSVPGSVLLMKKPL